ncbi:MAG TPA: winged helix-turn-helix domain-containing protein [Nitrosopumilaceae archaeon]|nr:winged helix-turn-helix domain-containing protein [Nitrosopumilaceae archaeon]
MINNKQVNESENIEIISTDDEKIKSFGELLSSDSSRKILKLLYAEVMTANQIAQKTGISLQLVRYHIKKLQDHGIVRIVKIEKNSKEHDMKYYSAARFAVVILPSHLSVKARESKSLFDSLKTIYRFAAIGIFGVLTWFGTISVQNLVQVPQKTSEYLKSGGYVGLVSEERIDLARRKLESFHEAVAESGSVFSTIGVPQDLFWPIALTALIVGIGISFEVLFRSYRTHLNNYSS